MAWQTVTRAIGGITPLGKFTISVGTPQNILANTSITTKSYAFQCRSLGFSVSSTVAGEVYVNYGNIAGLGNQTALIVQAGQSISLPIGAVAVDGLLDATQWWIDGSAACKVAVYALDGSTS
jgi:hypothetical protein